MSEERICKNCRFYRNLYKKHLHNKYGRCVHPLFVDIEQAHTKNAVIIFGKSVFPDEPGLIVKNDFSCQLFEEKDEFEETVRKATREALKKMMGCEGD